MTTFHGALGVAATTPHGTGVGRTTPKAFVGVADHPFELSSSSSFFFFFFFGLKIINYFWWVFFFF
jgi:hypothetical protein